MHFWPDTVTNSLCYFWSQFSEKLFCCAFISCRRATPDNCSRQFLNRFTCVVSGFRQFSELTVKALQNIGLLYIFHPLIHTINTLKRV